MVRVEGLKFCGAGWNEMSPRSPCMHVMSRDGTHLPQGLQNNPGRVL